MQTGRIMIHNHEEKSKETIPEMTQILDLSNKDFKMTICMLKENKRKRGAK